MDKPHWLFEKYAGWTVHYFMYGYLPTITGITRHSLRILSKALPIGITQRVINEDSKARHDLYGAGKIVSKVRIRVPTRYGESWKTH